MFSSGMGSAGAALRVAERFGTDSLHLIFADVNGEHPDNYRFLVEAASKIGGVLHWLDNAGETIWTTFARVKFLGNARVDPCSRVLKRESIRRYIESRWSPDTSVIYLGYDWTEEHRLERARPLWAPWTVDAPLCWDPPADRMSLGIEPPLLTRLGFPHANCGGGCVKAGSNHFAMLLRKLPATFAEWEEREQELRGQLGDVSILTDRRGGVRRPRTLRSLREDIERFENPHLDGEYGGCGCFSG